MSTLLTFPAPALPLVWLTKLLAVLVLLAVWAANVVVGTMKLLAANTLVADSSRTAAHKLCRHICPQERRGRGLSTSPNSEGGTRACRFPKTGGLSGSLSGNGSRLIEHAVQHHVTLVCELSGYALQAIAKRLSREAYSISSFSFF